MATKPITRPSPAIAGHSSAITLRPPQTLTGRPAECTERIPNGATDCISTHLVVSMPCHAAWRAKTVWRREEGKGAASRRRWRAAAREGRSGGERNEERRRESRRARRQKRRAARPHGCNERERRSGGRGRVRVHSARGAGVRRGAAARGEERSSGEERSGAARGEERSGGHERSGAAWASIILEAPLEAGGLRCIEAVAGASKRTALRDSAAAAAGACCTLLSMQMWRRTNGRSLRRCHRVVAGEARRPYSFCPGGDEGAHHASCHPPP